VFQALTGYNANALYNLQRQTAQGGFVRRGEVKKSLLPRIKSLQAPRRLI